MKTHTLHTAVLHPWSPWEATQPPSHVASAGVFLHSRYRQLKFGSITVATILEHAKPSGVRQYVLTWTRAGEERRREPLPKFDSFEDAHEHLMRLLKGGAEEGPK